ncbi:MAG: transposase domain-containing protein [gamma proteobacterium symbiont of Bathyaustriella thionipta]|nr:transposase domain-containing protein [gamma proteobacterium symbiont of Bathyaustriella thionipta]
MVSNVWIVATCSAPTSFQQKSQFFFLCGAPHKKKAWLFSDTPKGAQASGVHYSFIETAKANDIEPYAYLVDVLTQLPYADTVEKLEELLP